MLLSQGMPLRDIRSLPFRHRLALDSLMRSGQIGPVGEALRGLSLMHGHLDKPVGFSDAYPSLHAYRTQGVEDEDLGTWARDTWGDGED